jgi:adenylate cyclase
LAYLILDRIALSHYHLRQYDQALHYSEHGLSLRRAYFNRVVLLASLGQLGREDEARRLVPETLANVPADIRHPLRFRSEIRISRLVRKPGLLAGG